MQVDDQVALVVRRDEARRRVVEGLIGQQHEAAIDNEHQHAGAQSSPTVATYPPVSRLKPRLKTRNKSMSAALIKRLPNQVAAAATAAAIHGQGEPKSIGSSGNGLAYKASSQGARNRLPAQRLQ